MKLSFRQKLQVIKAYKESGGKDPLYSVLSKFENGGDLPEKSPTIVDNKLEDDNLVGMMKARMAMASQFGNTSAQRMTSVSPKTYQFTGNEQINGEYIGVPQGEVGTHFMSSMDNYAVPFIQERDGNMQFISNPSYKDSEAMRFDRPYDAEYFAEHYKEVAPMMQSFKGGGELPDTVKNPYSFPGKNKDKRPYLSVNNAEPSDAIKHIRELPIVVPKKSSFLSPVYGNSPRDTKWGDKIYDGITEAFDFPQKATVYALSGAVEAATNPMQLPVNPFGIKRMYATPSKYINSYFEKDKQPLNRTASFFIDAILDPLNFAYGLGAAKKTIDVFNTGDLITDVYDEINDKAKEKAKSIEKLKSK